MSGVLVHDGRRPGHHTWAFNAISAGAADGVFLSPFCTPRFAVPRYARASAVQELIVGARGELVFDATTHGLFLPGSNRVDLYDTWELWGEAGVGLDSTLRRQQHVERVFARQAELDVVHLTPTMALDSPMSVDATNVLETALVGAGIDANAWQSLVGSRTFWKSGPVLDAFVGRLAQLRSPTWIITVSNEIVANAFPDLSDSVAFAGLLRTVHSLSERSRVIVAHSDFSGLLGVAAGADSVGAGWDRGMRTLDPTTFHLDSDQGIRIPASYVTQQELAAVLKRDVAVSIERWNGPEALRLRGGAMPPSDQAERIHHLRAIRTIADRVKSAATRSARVEVLRKQYEEAASSFDVLIRAVPIVQAADKSTWSGQQLKVLEEYATAEGIW